MTKDIAKLNLGVNNVVPILFSAIAITASTVLTYSSMQTKMALQEQKLNQIIASQQETINLFKEYKLENDAKYTSMATRVGNHSVDIARLKQIEGIQ